MFRATVKKALGSIVKSVSNRLDNATAKAVFRLVFPQPNEGLAIDRALQLATARRYYRPLRRKAWPGNIGGATKRG
jgi:hypothetical protein